MSAVEVAPEAPALAAALRSARRRRTRRGALTVGALAVVLLVLAVTALAVGRTSYSLAEVAAVLLGRPAPGAEFTVGVLRLPRALVAVLAGAAFGMAGVTFQTMLRNPLASPDVIGIGSGASVAAVTGILFLHLDPAAVSFLALAGALGSALLISLLASVRGSAGVRLVLIGVGVAAVFDSLVSYQLLRASAWDLQAAMRWLTGSVNGATLDRVLPLALAVGLLGPVLAVLQRRLALLRLGDDLAAGLGCSVGRTRLALVLTAVGLMAFATAAAGPVAFVAFLSGPIAVRLVGVSGPVLAAAAAVGALLVLGSDLVGQFAFGTRYPVGVVTGALGAPFLLLLLIRSYRHEETR